MLEPAFKRTLDVALAGAALLVGAPILLAASAAIVLDSPGSPLFRQSRVGRGRRLIQTLKLRTMVRNGTGSEVTANHDPRITRLGRLLRQTKLDELPQLWNVVRGEMSLVGPRPEVARYVAHYRPEWEKLFTVRPGLTDLASIAFRDEERLLASASDPELAYIEAIMPIKLALALEGVEQSSVYYDLRILVQTVVAVVTGRTPRPEAVQEARHRIAELNRASK